MLKLIQDAKNREPNCALYLYYTPRESLYYIADYHLKVKMPDGSWKEHLHYIDCFNPSNTYARSLDMFKVDRWQVLTASEAREFYETGKLPE